jgi:hypothetical protein
MLRSSESHKIGLRTTNHAAPDSHKLGLRAGRGSATGGAA